MSIWTACDGIGRGSSSSGMTCVYGLPRHQMCGVRGGKREQTVQHYLPASTRLLSAAAHQSSNVNFPAILAVPIRCTNRSCQRRRRWRGCGCGCQRGSLVRKQGVVCCGGPGVANIVRLSSQTTKTSWRDVGIGMKGCPSFGGRADDPGNANRPCQWRRESVVNVPISSRSRTVLLLLLLP